MASTLSRSPALRRDLQSLDRETSGNPAPGRYADGYDMANRFNTDGLGITYLTIVAVWTCLLFTASVFLVRNRHLPYLRIRNIPLAVSAVATLHIDWILCMIAYVLNGYFPCATEYWIMSIYLPLGIALFHATNSQLLSIATAQKKYAHGEIAVEVKAEISEKAPVWRKCWQKLKAYNATKNTMAWIGMGMIVQVFATLIVFLISRKFHPSFGVTGVVVSRSMCRRGWEWWPSIAWQIFWSWIYGPILLWRVRNVSDNHGWRSQTIACICAGLPASPMWLIALYAEGMKAVNFYFVPPMWFSASIITMQASVIFIPLFQVLKNRKLESETRDIIAEWEEKQKSNGSIASASTNTAARSRYSTRKSVKSTTSSLRGEMYTMSALEKTLKLNPTPLLMFSALKDFSGENISFLVHVRDWKTNWTAGISKTGLLRKQGQPKGSDTALLRRQFQQAVGIYASFVSLKYSAFPINISSAHLRDLEAIFEEYAALVCAEPAANAATPFDNYWSSAVSEDLESQPGKGAMSAASTIVGDSSDDNSKGELRDSHQLRLLKMTNFGERLPATIGIPDSFDETIFDKAELSIKELVLTNTWAKFVKAGFAQNHVKSSIAAHIGATFDACRIRLPAFKQVYRK